MSIDTLFNYSSGLPDSIIDAVKIEEGKVAITIAATTQTTDTTMIIILEEMILKLEQVTTIVDDLIITITVGEKPFKLQVSYIGILFSALSPD